MTRTPHGSAKGAGTRADTRIEGGRPIRTFWSEQRRRFELDARLHRWREVPGIGPRPAPCDGWNPLAG